MSDERGPRERIYDAEITPLMAQIIAICKRAGIPVVAKFELDAMDENPDDPLYCTTAIVPADASDAMKRLDAVARPAAPMAFAETITTEPDGTKRVSIRRMA